MATKQTCVRCGKEHWNFKRCEVADEANAREAELAEIRHKNRVIPVPCHDPAARSGMSDYRQVGVNRFVRAR